MYTRGACVYVRIYEMPVCTCVYVMCLHMRDVGACARAYERCLCTCTCLCLCEPVYMCMHVCVSVHVRCLCVWMIRV